MNVLLPSKGQLLQRTRRASTAMIAGIVLSGVIAVPAHAECRAHVESVVVELTATSAGETHYEATLSRWISLEHVSVVYIDSYQFTKSGLGTSSCSWQLLADDVLILDSGQDAYASFVTPWSLVSHSGFVINETASVNKVRFTIDQSTSTASATFRGIHAGNTVKVGFVAGPLAPEGPHRVFSLGAWPSQTLVNNQFTPWQQYSFPEPVAGSDLWLVTGGGPHTMSWTQTDISACVQAQLVFDNGVILDLDDWASPSVGTPAPPADHVFSWRWLLHLDAETAASIDGASATTFRWRFQSRGEGSVTVNYQDQPIIAFVYDHVVCPADIDCSGEVGFGDILRVIAAWGPCVPDCVEDVSGNGDVDFADILAVIAAWGPCP
ncbi:MAG: hypothetical protein ACYTGP_12775 [Planctomycetota bacterium]|jgi:hypothetical protein